MSFLSRCPRRSLTAICFIHIARGTLQELLLIRKYGKQQAGIDLLKLNQGEQKKKKKKKEVEGEGEGDGEGEGGEDDYGLQVKGSAKVVDEEDE